MNPHHTDDTGLGSWRNPVVPGCYPDPSVCRVGDDYYLAASTFEYVPGIPILHSRDLVHWTTIGHAVADLPGLRQVASSQGLFAPTLRHIGGRFVMVTTLMPDGRSFFVTADDPAGPWGAPIFVDDEWSMDPSLMEDADGTVYFTRHGEGRHGGVFQAVIDLTTGALDAPPREIWRGTDGIWPEGPHLYRVGDWYVLLISEGGTSYDHSLTVARSRSPWGPFEAYPGNPILTHRHLPDHPLQAIGHADLVDTPDGAWFMVLLGIRPVDRAHHLGRETFLAPVRWVDGWPVTDATVEPVMRAPGLPLSLPVPSPAPDTDALPGTGPEWFGLRSPADGRWVVGERGLVLHGLPATLDDLEPVAFVCRRQQHLDVVVSAVVEFEPVDSNDVAGLALRLSEERHVVLGVTQADGLRAVELRITDPGGCRLAGAATVGAGPVELVVSATATEYICAFRSVRSGAALRTLGVVPTRTLAVLEAESFIGVVVGPYASSWVGTEALVTAWSYRPSAGDETLANRVTT